MAQCEMTKVWTEWINEFASSPDPFASPKKKEEAIKAFQVFEELKEADFLNVEQWQDMCTLIENYISQGRPRAELGKDQTLVLDPFFLKLLDFIISLSITNTDIQAYLRDQTTLMTNLTSYLTDKYQKLGHAKILKSIEVLSRSIVVSWSIPYLPNLIKQTFTILLTPNTPHEVTLYVLRIISNLIFNNQNCLNIVLREANYKVVLKRVIDLLSEEGATDELKTMGVNFCFLTDQSIAVTLSSQINNIRNTYAEIQNRIDNDKSINMQNIASTVYYTKMCVSVCLTRSNKMLQEESQDNSQSTKKVKSIVETILDDIYTTVFSKFVPKVFPLLRTEKGQTVVESILNLLKSLCSDEIPAREYDRQWEKITTSLNELSLLALPKSRAQIAVLETHLHIVDRILKSNRSNISVDSFKFALDHCEITVSSRPVDLTKNILTIRLLNRLSSLAHLQTTDANGQAMTKVSKLLSEDSLLKLLNELLSDDDTSHAPCIQMSTCIVAVLNAISKLSKSTTKLIQSLEKEKTWFHISNCIANGNEELITQALSLLGVVGFSAKCRTGVSRTLMEMKESYSSKALPVSPERPVSLSFAAQMGLKKLNDNLEMFDLHHHTGNDGAIDDVLAWYKLKSDMHEMELTNMNEHIFHLNRVISRLKLLLNKQSELVTRRAVSTTTLQKEYHELQRQLEVTKEKKIDTETKHLKAVQSLRKQLAYQEGLYKTKCERLNGLEQERLELIESCEALTKSRDEAQDSSNKHSTEKRKLQDKLEQVEKDYKTSRQKLSTMENDLKKSEEARRTAETLLEAERRKTEIIQQVLGQSS